MFSIALANLGSNPDPEKNKRSWFNFELGSLWKYGKFSITTTLYLGLVTVYIMFVIVIATLGDAQKLITSLDIRIWTYIILGCLPFLIGFIAFMEFAYNNKEVVAKEKKGRTTTIKALPAKTKTKDNKTTKRKDK